MNPLLDAPDAAGLVAGAVEREPLGGHDGRSGASLERVRLADGTRLVVKRSRPDRDLGMQATADASGRELALWESGVLGALPPGVGHAVVGGWRDGDEVVVVMRDLGPAVITWRSAVGVRECGRILTAAAAVHAAFRDRPVDGLCPLVTRLALFSPRRLGAPSDPAHPLLRAALRGWRRFADLAPPDVTAAVATLHDDPAPLAAALARRGTTLTHGDLWLVNTALEADRVVLLDWGTATAAPGALDFATFLMGASGVPAGHDELLGAVRAAAGGAHDETALRLALLAALVDLGWNKALDAADHPDPAVRAREAAELSWWAGQARRTLDSGLL